MTPSRPRRAVLALSSPILYEVDDRCLRRGGVSSPQRKQPSQFRGREKVGPVVNGPRKEFTTVQRLGTNEPSESKATASDSKGEQPDQVSAVTTLELFFDLVFVFTLTQLSRLLSEELNLVGLLRVTLIFGILWYMYGGYVWLTNQVPPRHPRQQLLLLIGMAGFLGTAVAIPDLFDQTGPLFGIGYGTVVVVHLIMFLLAGPVEGVVRLAPFNLAAAGMVLAAGLVPGPGRPLLLAGALVLQFITPYLGVAPRFVVKSSHFVERHGLLMIVALGETVIAVGLGVDPTNFDGLVLLTMLLAFALPAALWWDYFANESQSAVVALEDREQSARSLVAIRSYFYAHIPMLLGVVVLAAGIHEALAHASEPLSWAAAAALGGGVGMFFLGDAEFRRALGLGSTRLRFLAALLAFMSIPVGAVLPAWAHVLLLAGLAVALILRERAAAE